MAESAHLLKLNNFNMPVVFKDDQAAYVHIVYLILLEPGKFQSHPEMGVGLRSKWRYYASNNLELELRNEINRQIEQFLPELRNVSVDVSIEDAHIVTIMINTANGAYAIQYDRKTNDVKIASDNELTISDL